jgi:hypothetical protein
MPLTCGCTMRETLLRPENTLRTDPAWGQRTPPSSPTAEAIFTNSSRTKFVNSTDAVMYINVYGRVRGVGEQEGCAPQEAKYVERWPNTTSAWDGWSRFDILVDRYCVAPWEGRVRGSCE